MSASTIGDYLSIIGLYKYSKSYLPNTIIIGVDPWIFNSNSEYNYRWTRLQTYYFKLIDEINYNQEMYHSDINDYDNTIAKLFSLNCDRMFYTQKNIPTKSKIFSLVDKKHLGSSVRNPDGSIKYPDDYLNRDYKLIFEDANNPFKYRGGLNDFISFGNKIIFEID